MMLCCLLLVVLHPVYTITITPTKSVSSATTWPYSSFFDTVQLGPQDETGSFLITQMADVEDPRDIYCDDYWNDHEAEDLCRKWNYKFGRRASQALEDAQTRFFGIMPHCYDWSAFDGFTVFALEKCSVVTLVPEYQGCSNDEVAAVHCWNEEFFNKYLYISHSASKKKWSLNFKMYNVKFGRQYNVVGEDSLIKTPKSKDFQVRGCEKLISAKLSVDKKKKSLKLKGKWNKTCDECLEFFYEGEKLFTDVCMTQKKKKADYQI